MAAIDRDRWRVIEPLLDSALELPMEQRDGWLDALRAESPTLAADLAALLDAERSADRRGLLVEPLATPFTNALGGSLEGTELGAYTLERPLGHGGMGSVWLARRTDGRFEGRVAVKLLALALLTRAGQERFRREGSALARLTHPGIARLLDAGVSAGGQPYLVLEYVDGVTIDAWADARSLGTTERVRLVLDVLDAVAHAHANLVVHRDLKPSNILVTADGHAKLLDFGIAKLLDVDVAARTTLTAEEGRALTPEFAAPEQVRGDPVTTATDVYAAGVLLYLLLSGRHPTAEGRRTPTDVVAATLAVQPARLGLGDLDTILAKALRKEPHERYQTAAALADDLSRYLRHEPVRARGDSLAYRVRKFVRRHRVAVAGAAAGVVLLAGAGLRERTLRARAQAEARKAAVVAQYLESVFGGADPYGVPNEKPGDVTARVLLDRGAARIDSALAGEPDVQAQLRVALGRVYVSLGVFDRAVPVLRRALGQRRTLYGPRHPAVAEVANALGVALREVDSLDAAEPLLREALAQRRAFASGPDTGVATSLRDLSVLLEERDDLAGAERLLREALAIRRSVYGPASEQVAASLGDLGVLFYQQSRYDEAEPLQRQALAIKRRLYGDEHVITAFTMHDLAQVQAQRDHLAEAESLYRRALAVDRKALGSAHPVVVLDLNNFGDMLYRLAGRPGDAVPLLRESLAITRKLYGARHRDAAAALNNLSNALRGIGDFAGAEAAVREAMEINTALYGPEHSRVALNLNSLGGVLAQSGRNEEAIPIFRQALALTARTEGPDDQNTLVTTSNLGRALRDAGHLAEAERVLRALLARSDTATAAHRLIQRTVLVALGRTLTQTGRAAEARPLLERGLALASGQLTASDPRLADARYGLGACLVELGEYARADTLLRQARAALDPQRRAQPLLSALTDTALARLAERSGGRTK
ncbi:protein kinase (plasmid) [Gemmatirosa kalamazoonensis]|uniref:Protein kinase n=1 Tax=Gemmatirosa kalamazoonensis TaxID=861299 RepID=W0RPR7_9BACT|nr:serine/threonine-protein kinase [Gemmatirosa kalamazoonensis]AHG92487.1 protein kinase [Gemmatirosa kalamazoonensis]